MEACFYHLLPLSDMLAMTCFSISFLLKPYNFSFLHIFFKSTFYYLLKIICHGSFFIPACFLYNLGHYLRRAFATVRVCNILSMSVVLLDIALGRASLR